MATSPEPPIEPSGNPTASAPPADAKPQAGKPDYPRGPDGRPVQFSLPLELVEHILLGPAGDRRVLQDSPLLGDVWAAYALDPGVVRDVLITPHKDSTAASVASAIPKALEIRKAERAGEQKPTPSLPMPVSPKIAYLQGLVGARLRFHEVLRILVPWTQWWREPRIKDRIEDVDRNANQGKLKKLLQRDRSQQPTSLIPPSEDDFSSLQRYIALAGLIYWIGKLTRLADHPDGDPPKFLPPLTFEQAFPLYQPYVDEIIKGVFELYGVVKADPYTRGRDAPRNQDVEAEEGEKSSPAFFRYLSTALLRRRWRDRYLPSRPMRHFNCSGSTARTSSGRCSIRGSKPATMRSRPTKTIRRIENRAYGKHSISPIFATS